MLPLNSLAVASTKKAMDVSLRGLQQAGDVAAIILPEEVFAAISDAARQLDNAQAPGDIERKFVELQEVLDRAHTEIAAIARRDLQIPLAQYSAPQRAEG
jgi:hypothetical protein